MDSQGIRFLLVLSIVTAPLAAGAFVFSFESSQYFSNFAPAYDGYVPPRDVGKIVDQTQAATVEVRCRIRGSKEVQFGSGWAGDLPRSTTQLQPGFVTNVVTNFHVIDTCVLNPEANVKIRKFLGKWREAYINRIDKKNDLALLTTKAKIPRLDLSEWPPYPGYWTMAVGSADGYQGSVAIGSVLNLLRTEVLITNNISSGNSGGPLVDNMGDVVGIVTWSSRDEQYNGAKTLDAMCKRILDCDGETFWNYG